MVVIVPAGHELAGAGAIDREALAGLPFVSLHRSSTVAAIRAELESHGIDWQHLRVVMARPFAASCRPPLLPVPHKQLGGPFAHAVCKMVCILHG